jgi:cyclopropane fatty-acyl-phospholipid synthase-like methyltransferase
MERAPNSYYNLKLNAEQIAKNAHRGVVGGNWDKTREITMKYLKKAGLKKSHNLLDLGCGSFRNGIAIIDYLNNANYYGQDICPDLIKAGYEKELKPLGLDAKLPKKNLASNKSFALSKFKVKFDFVLAVSLFSHLPKEIFVDALVKLKPKMAKGGKAHMSFFLVDEDQPEGKKAWPEIRVNTYSDRDPFHYKWSQIEEICKEAGWKSVELGTDPGYPRKQQFAVFSV